MIILDSIRTINRILKGKETVDGAGVKLVRVFSNKDAYDFDPFLLLDAFDSTNPKDYTKGFPWHPHRGIETVTYLIQGRIEHGDSLNNSGTITDGDCQWMTAGSGILHQEMPKESDRMLGVQLWVNLPEKDKMTQPTYRDLKSSDIPVIKEEDSEIRLIAGKYKDIEGPAKGLYVKPRFMDVKIKKNGKLELETDDEMNLFVYIIQGYVSFEKEPEKYINEKSGILFNKGNKLVANTGGEGTRFLIFEGKPLNEPIAWGGPIVMNTREELNKAFAELEEGTFIKA